MSTRANVVGSRSMIQRRRGSFELLLRLLSAVQVDGRLLLQLDLRRGYGNSRPVHRQRDADALAGDVSVPEVLRALSRVDELCVEPLVGRDTQASGRCAPRHTRSPRPNLARFSRLTLLDRVAVGQHERCNKFRGPSSADERSSPQASENANGIPVASRNYRRSD